MPQSTPYQPLTPQQYGAAKAAGFSADQIIQHEQTRKAASTGAPAAVSQPQTFGQKVLGAVDTATGVINSIGKPFIDLAATPVQLLAKSLGQKDPYAEGYPNLAKSANVPTSLPVPQAPSISSLDNPSQKIGSAIEAASYAFPYGKVAEAGAGLTEPLLGKTLGKFAGNVASGLAGGYGVDVGANLQEGKPDYLTPGLGTAIGGAIPVIPPVLGAAARGVGESLGVSTGAGYGAVKEAFNASSAGGERAKAFTDALRGKTPPEAIVNEADDALKGIIQKRTADYQAQLADVTKDNTKSFDISPVQEKLDSMLKDFNVNQNPDTGALDFSRSPGLGRYKSDLGEIQDVLDNWGTQAGDRTVVGIDKLKQTLDDFRRSTADSRKFDSFVTALRNSAQDIIRKEPGYAKLVGDYAEKTGLIKDIQKGLSLGDKASIDTGFRKLTTALRTNNEFRKELVNELDQASGGYLSSQIAGQQLSEALPRGLARQIEGFGALGAVTSGIGILPILKVAAFASPRVVGEIVNALGISKRVFTGLLDHLGAQEARFPGDRAVEEAGPAVKNYLDAHPPSLGLAMKDITKMGTAERRALGYPGYDAGSKKLAEAFDQSTDQVKVGNFELGSFGRNAGERKIAQKDRFPESELGQTQNYIVGKYRASDNPSSYRFDNTAHVSKMPDGETRVIYTRLNKNNAQEIVNWHKVSDPRYIEQLKSFGAPAQSRTGITSLEAGRTNPLSDGSLPSIPQNLKAAPEAFAGFKDITTTLLDDLKGRATVSKQYVLDALNRQGVTQGEKDAFTSALDSVGTEGKNLNVKELADAVKTELLPLERAELNRTRYENVNLPEEVRGPVAKYNENVYESPIGTSAGGVHFGNIRQTDRFGNTVSEGPQNYFAHTRTEDLPAEHPAATFLRTQEEDRAAGRPISQNDYEKAKNILKNSNFPSDSGTTRRVIEIQSDLFQKGRLETEAQSVGTGANRAGAESIAKEDPNSFAAKQLNRESEIAKLRPYENTWQDRIIREEVKQAAKDGKTKLLFPTGETAMNIEGLVNRADKWVTLDNEVVNDSNIKKGDLITYQDHEGQPHEDRRWLITKNNGDGTFDAVDSLTAENDHTLYNLLDKKGLLDDGRLPSLEELHSVGALDDKEVLAALDKLSEHLSAQDTVDKQNPIYKFYESDIRKFLQKRYNANLIADERGVSWYQVDVPKEAAKLPVKAFAAAPVALLGAQQALSQHPKQLQQ